MAKWTPRHEAPEPLEGPVVATVTGGTILWFVLFLAQLPFYGWFDDHGYLWWLWTCLAGGGLGFIGIWYVRRWEAALKRAATEAEAEADARTEADADADAVTETDADAGPEAGHDSTAATTENRHVTP